jgi:hypothetical protein
MVILCSNCGHQLMVPAEVLGKQVKCPLCKIVFAAPPSPTTSGQQTSERNGDPKFEPPARVSPPKDDGFPSVRRPVYGDDDGGRAPRRSRYDDDEDSRRDPSRSWYGRYDDDDDYERMRRRGRSDMDKAESAVMGPAICLMILGALFIVAGAGCLLFSMQRDVFGGFRVFLLVSTLIAFCWGGFIILGGVMMKNLKSYPIAMAASIMALINYPCFMIHFFFAIWAIVALSKPEVRRAFRWKAGNDWTP